MSLVNSLDSLKPAKYIMYIIQ